MLYGNGDCGQLDPCLVATKVGQPLDSGNPAWSPQPLHSEHLHALTRNTGKTNWFIDEFGVVLPVVVIAFAVYFWRRRAELPIGNTDLMNPSPIIETGRAATP